MYFYWDCSVFFYLAESGMEEEFDFDAAIREDQERIDMEGDDGASVVDSDMEDIGRAELLYMDPQNSNNMSRSLKIIDVEEVSCLPE